MTSVARLSVAGLLALTAGLGIAGAVYLRPLQPPQPQPQTEIAPVAPPAPTIRTVTWFKAHPNEMNAKRAACRDNQGVGRHDPECPNASAAGLQLDVDADLAQGRAQGVIK
jgi:hypothetical protein